MLGSWFCDSYTSRNYFAVSAHVKQAWFLAFPGQKTFQHVCNCHEQCLAQDASKNERSLPSPSSSLACSQCVYPTCDFSPHPFCSAWRQHFQNQFNTPYTVCIRKQRPRETTFKVMIKWKKRLENVLENSSRHTTFLNMSTETLQTTNFKNKIIEDNSLRDHLCTLSLIRSGLACWHKIPDESRVPLCYKLSDVLYSCSPSSDLLETNWC